MDDRYEHMAQYSIPGWRSILTCLYRALSMTISNHDDPSPWRGRDGLDFSSWSTKLCTIRLFTIVLWFYVTWDLGIMFLAANKNIGWYKIRIVNQNMARENSDEKISWKNVMTFSECRNTWKQYSLSDNCSWNFTRHNFFKKFLRTIIISDVQKLNVRLSETWNWF